MNISDAFAPNIVDYLNLSDKDLIDSSKLETIRDGEFYRFADRDEIIEEILEKHRNNLRQNFSKFKRRTQIAFIINNPKFILDDCFINAFTELDSEELKSDVSDKKEVSISTQINPVTIRTDFDTNFDLMYPTMSNKWKEELIKLALEQEGMLLGFVYKPKIEMEMIAIKSDPKVYCLIDSPSKLHTIKLIYEKPDILYSINLDSYPLDFYLKLVETNYYLAFPYFDEYRYQYKLQMHIIHRCCDEDFYVSDGLGIYGIVFIYIKLNKLKHQLRLMPKNKGEYDNIGDIIGCLEYLHGTGKVWGERRHKDLMNYYKEKNFDPEYVNDVNKAFSINPVLAEFVNKYNKEQKN